MRAEAVVLGCVLDALLGEPPVAHPVRGMGRLLLAGKRYNASRLGSPGVRAVTGAALVAAGSALCWRLGRALGPEARGARSALTLSWVVSLRELLRAGRGVRQALERGDLERARAALGRDLVSRDTAGLDAGEVSAAALQSLAENLNDAFVAPVLWSLVGGTGAAYAYRFVNTADAVLGYRTPELRWFGWTAARSDDLASWIPARVAAAALVLAAPTVSGSGPGAVRAVRTSASATPSPNGGWPMSALAGALGVRLEKRGGYVLNPEGRTPSTEDLRRGEHLVAAAAAASLGLMLGVRLLVEQRR